MLKTIDHAFRSNVLLIGAGSLSARYLFGDLIVQVAIEGRQFRNEGITSYSGNDGEESVRYFQWERLATFGSFGFMYGGSIGYFFYNKVYGSSKIFRRRPFLTAVFDVCTHCMFLYMPAFYVTQSMVFENADRMKRREWGAHVSVSPLSQQFVCSALAKAKAEYEANFAEDFRNMSLVWIPLHTINFGLIPLQYRLPFISLAGVLWAAVMSGFRGEPSAELEQADDADGPFRDEEISRVGVSMDHERHKR